MRSLFQRLADFARCMIRLRPHIRAGRPLIAAVLSTTVVSACLEGVGIGLLIPLLGLLLSDPGTSSLTFSVGDIRSLRSFAAELAQHSDTVSAFLWSQCSPATRQALAAYQGFVSDPAPLEKELVQELNRVVQGGSIYEAQRFAGVKLSPKTLELLRQNPAGQDRERLNRLLLEDAYPLEISTSQGASSAKSLRRVQEWMPDRSRGFYVSLFCCLVLGAIVAKNGVLYLSQVLAAKLRRRIAQNLRRALFYSLQHAELTVFEQRSAGEMTNTFQREMYVSMLMLEFVVQFVQRSSMAVMYVCVLIYLSPPLTTLTLVLACLVGGTVSIFYKRIGRGGEQLTALSRRFGARLTEVFGGIRVIRATNSQAREIGRFEEINEALGDVDEHSTRATAILAPVAETVAVAGAMVIIGLAYFLLVKPGAMTNLQLMGFGFVLLRILPLMNQIYGLQGNLFYMSPSILEVEKWIQVPKFPQRPFGQAEFAEVRRSIRFDKVELTYPNGTKALEEITFEMPSGRTVALVGASGSGKSTIAALLLRFRQPTGGRITVDGTDYWEFSPESWHRAVGVVEQEAFLFHDSMENNIGYGCPGATSEDIAEAVRIANLADVVAALPEGLRTTIGERGIMLSGGQRQRLAIARALVRQPRILVLDEATSALDNVSEQQVQTALDVARHGRTVLVIAHRLTTVRHADNIVVLSEGRVLEQGSWEELMARNGEFTRLVNSVFADSKPMGVPLPAEQPAESAFKDKDLLASGKT